MVYITLRIRLILNINDDWEIFISSETDWFTEIIIIFVNLINLHTTQEFDEF